MKVTAGLLLAQAMTRFADQVALTDAAGDQTYAELDSTANRIGHGLKAFGIGPGDRFGVLSYNRREVVHAWMGCERAGVVRTVLHSHFDFSAHVILLRQVSAKAIMFDTRFTDQVDAHRDELGSIVLFAVGDNPPDWAIPWAEVAAQGSEEPIHVDVDEDEPYAIQPTTGTTGAPKPWIATHRGWQMAMDQDMQYYDTFPARALPIGTDDVALHAHALQWASGWHLLYPLMMRGGRNVIVDDEIYDPAKVLELIVSEHVTTLLLPAPMLTPVLDLAEQYADLAHQLKRLLLFFGTPELLTRTSKVFGSVWSNNYCSTEQGAITTRLTAQDAELDPALLETVGNLAAPLIDLAIVDDTGVPVSVGRPGEIVVRSAVTNSKYWEMPDKTAAAFFEGDWFRTGDVGHLDANGYLTYADRAGDAIRTTHSVVYPHAVEAALLRHSAVANCGVVGDGSRLLAGVLLKDGVDDTPELREEILNAARPGLADQEIPEIIVLDELPTVLGGAKVRRLELRDRLFGESL